MTMIMVAPINAPEGALFGYGVNQLTDARIPESCVKNLPAPTISIPSDNGDHMFALIVKDSATYSQMMSTVSNLSASGVSWSASASVSYLRDQAGSDTTITLTWTRIARTQDRMADWTKASIDPDAIAYLQAHGADAFIAKYGTHCIIGIAYGGSLSGYARLETQSVSDKEQLSAAISGSVSDFGVHGSVSENFETQLASSNVHYTSSQDANVIGASAMVFTGLDIQGMSNAVRTFAPSDNGPLPGVKGAPVGLICASWDEFDDIVNAVSDPGSVGLAVEEHTLLTLAAEYTALTYLTHTAALLPNSSGIIPAYGPTLVGIANQADAARSTISRLTLQQVRDFAASGTANYMISTALKPQVDKIARGIGKIQIYYQLDWAFDYVSGTTTYEGVPGIPEVNLCHYNHARPEGTEDGPQVLTLLYTYAVDSNNIPYIGTRMHYQDPYAPAATQQQDLASDWTRLNQSDNLSCTSAWPGFPYNFIRVTLVPPTG